MSSRLNLTAREVIQKLRRAGFIFDRHGKGSHELWYNPETHRRVTVPNHPGNVAKGTLRAIIRDSGLTTDEFMKL